jgi:hypothetical protein
MVNVKQHKGYFVVRCRNGCGCRIAGEGKATPKRVRLNAKLAGWKRTEGGAYVCDRCRAMKVCDKTR